MVLAGRSLCGAAEKAFATQHSRIFSCQHGTASCSSLSAWVRGVSACVDETELAGLSNVIFIDLRPLVIEDSQVLPGLTTDGLINLTVEGQDRNHRPGGSS